jgi:hypothetical protein
VIWMKKLMVLCLSLALLTGSKKKAGDTSTGAKAQPPVASTAPSSPTTPSVASGATTLPTKASEQQPRGQSSATPKEPTLAQVLAAAGLKPPVEVVKDLDHPITSYAALLDDRDAYVIAYYWSLPSGTLEDPLRVLSFNRQTQEWKSAELMLGGDQIGHSECVGSVLHADALPTAFLLDTHINPSASCLIVVDRNLAFRNALFGWYLAAVSDTQIVFQRSEVHFAAVHPAELALYDLTTKQETSLFPRKPFQRIRSEYTARLRDFYRTHEEWCRENNDPCEPETVDSSLEGEIAFNHREHALAFVIDYDSYDRFRGSSGLVQKPVNPGKVIYVYRYVNDEAKLDYREMLVSDVEKRFGKLSLRALLAPTVLQEIFCGTVGS